MGVLSRLLISRLRWTHVSSVFITNPKSGRRAHFEKEKFGTPKIHTPTDITRPSLQPGHANEAEAGHNFN